MRKPVVAIAGLLVAAAACTNDAAVDVRTPPPGAQRGGTIDVAIGEPLSLDPHLTDALDPSAAAIATTMCDTLVQLDPATGDVRPAIAESWQITQGGRRMTVRLRRGVRFHDGSEVTADDVVFSLSRLASRDTASPVASILQPVAGYEQVHGNDEVEDEAERTQLTGLRVIEPHSFEVELDEAHADFVRAFSHPATAPVPRAAVEADQDAFGRRPVCAGPYRLAGRWEPGQRVITLRRFEGYHATSVVYSSGGGGYADTIRFRVYASRSAQLQAFDAGAVDVAHAPAEGAADLGRLGDDRVVVPTPTLDYVGLPTSRAPFDRRAVRIALSQALDRERLSDAVYAGLRRPATSFLPPALGRIHRPDACGEHTPPRGDVAAARASLRRAGVDLEGEQVPLLFNDEFGHAALVTEIARQWRDAFGVEVRPSPMGWDDFLDAGLRQPGFAAPFRMSWTPQYQTPDLYLGPLFDSSSIGRDNFSRFSDDDFDRMLERDAREAVAPEDLRDRYRDLEQLVCGEMPVIPLTYGARVYAIRTARIGSAVEGWASRSSGMLVARELYLR